jgi:hypothetical protein
MGSLINHWIAAATALLGVDIDRPPVSLAEAARTASRQKLICRSSPDRLSKVKPSPVER